MMGYSKLFDTRASTYKVIINSFKHLPDTKIDAAFGLSGLAFLYIARYVLNRIERNARNPVVRRTAFFANTFRTAFLVIVSTAASYGYLRYKNPKKLPISVIGKVPSGFQDMGVPIINSDLISLIAPEIPITTILVFLEHIAISKSFGRVNNYKINPNQELVAIGFNNIISTFFGACESLFLCLGGDLWCTGFVQELHRVELTMCGRAIDPSTGSFSRTAIKSRAGVRTPLAGVLTAVVVLVALYGLTSAFFWIPNATLAAVISK